MVSDQMQSGSVKSAIRTLDIIEFIVAQDAAVPAQSIAKSLEIPVSSLSYLLSTLVDREYLVRDGRKYRPGSGLSRLQARSSPFTLADTVAPTVKSVRRALNETTSFFIRVDWDVEPIVTEASDHALRYSIDIGVRKPMHALAAGKAILAALDEGDLKRYFSESTREKLTKNTLVSERQIRSELAKVRKNGIARSTDELLPGVMAFARVVFNENNELSGALSVAIPTARFSSDKERAICEILDEHIADLKL